MSNSWGQLRHLSLGLLMGLIYIVLTLSHSWDQLGECHAVQQGIKARLCSRKRVQQKEETKPFQNQLSSTLQHSMELSQEKGASA